MSFTTRRIILGALFGLTASGLAAQPSSGSGPIHLVVGAAPGGTVDTMARLLANGVGQQLNQAVVVENRPGANGAIAADIVARAQPDGQTLLLGTSGYTILPLLQSNLPYGQTDLEPIAIAAVTPFLLFTGPEAPFSTIQEMIEYSRANPDALSAASGDGATLMASELLKFATGITAVAVNYRSGGQMVQDVSTGLADYAFLGATAVMPLARANRVRVLGIADDERLHLAPDVPTLAEQGVEGVRMTPWLGLMAPAGTDAAVVERLAQAVASTTETQDFQQKVAEIGSLVRFMGPAEARDYLADEAETFGRVARSAGIEPVD